MYAIGVSSNEKDKIAAYQPKDVARTWYTQWKESGALRGGTICWEVFRKTFLDWFFPREKREAKVEEFINLPQGCMCLQEYSLKFIKLSKYDSSFVSNPRDEMIHFVMGMYDYLVEEYRVVMIHDNIDFSRLMVHTQKVEARRLKRKYRDTKRARPYDGVTSMGKFEIQEKPKIKKRLSNQVSSNLPKANKYR